LFWRRSLIGASVLVFIQQSESECEGVLASMAQNGDALAHASPKDKVMENFIDAVEELMMFRIFEIVSA
jgi:hypothetical protein